MESTELDHELDPRIPFWDRGNHQRNIIHGLSANICLYQDLKKQSTMFGLQNKPFPHLLLLPFRLIRKCHLFPLGPMQQ